MLDPRTATAGAITLCLVVLSGLEVNLASASAAGSSGLVVSTEISARNRTKQPADRKKAHRLVVQVDTNDPAVMNLVLNNVSNVTEYYKKSGQTIEIEVVAFGPGLHMLRDDTSPVKSRIGTMSEAMPHVTFSACGNTRENMTKAEKKDIPLISQAKVVGSGVVQIMELQERGWSYLRP
ncbi:MAG: hypothetical protein JWQ94_1547 [Tardiphaga sp.]|jgi:intracellular sulfur oxidation DsrE/DsrF family protein|nr:hypothetical protein [Tardiphaga sp.]